MDAVWVTRPGEGGARTTAALTAHGYDAVHAPLLAVTYAAVDAPPPDGPDWILFVSPNAVEGFRRAFGGGSHFVATKVAGVGERTADTARAAGFRVDLVPGDQQADGLLAALAAEDLAGLSVWIPAGNQEGSATRALPEALAARGARPRVFGVYAVEPRPLDGAERATLAARRPGAVLVASPSAVRALAAALDAASELSAWRDAELVAIGPVTAAEIRRLGLGEPRVAAAPSDEGILRLLDGLAAPHP